LIAFRLVGGTALTELWSGGPAILSPVVSPLNQNMRPGSPGLADFNGDGKPELYIRNRIYAAESGTLLADGGGDWLNAINTGSVAVDMDNDGQLELVCGNLIYKVTNPNAPSPRGSTLTLTLWKDMNADFPSTKFYPKVFKDPPPNGSGPYGFYGDGPNSTTQASTTSTADFDGDGYVDVFISGAINCSGGSVACGTNATTIFYWNVHKNTVQTYTPPDATYPLGWVNGTGRINLYDVVPNHGKLEALFIAGTNLFCLDSATFAGGAPKAYWTYPSVGWDPSGGPGIMALTCFDFTNKGTPQVVFRDINQLTVLNGQTGALIWTSPCPAWTFVEGPIIADVVGNGQTDICTICYSGPFKIAKNTPQEMSHAKMSLWHAGGSWLPTRKVWNQNPYFVLNINDDLTLPAAQIPQVIITGTGTCSNGVKGPQRPFNLFMDQTPFLGPDGCPEFPAPNITFYGDTPSTNPACSTASPPASCDTNGDGKYDPAVVVTPPICGNLGISVQFNITNNGALSVSDNIPISFFNGDPTANPTTAVRLYNINMPLPTLAIGATYNSPTYTFNGPGTAFTLYIVMYNDGSVLPVTFTAVGQKQCTISDKMYSVAITPTPFTVTTQVLQDNTNCPPYAAASNTGHVQAHIYLSGTPLPSPLPTEPAYGGYNFQWYDSNKNPIAGATNYDLGNLDQGTYYVNVTDKVKGCSSGLVAVTVARSQPPFPTFNVTKVSDQTTCSPLNGHLTVAPSDGSTGYIYTWLSYPGLVQKATGADANGLASGNYIVQITRGTCTNPVSPSPTFINGPAYPDASASTVANIVDCVNKNTGSVTANALISGVAQNPAGYTFNWYTYDAVAFPPVGSPPAPPNNNPPSGSPLPAPNNGSVQTPTGLAAGWYQVSITDNTTKCQATSFPITQITTTTVLPTVSTIRVAKQTSCDPTKPNGILTAVASATGYTNPTDFKFEWFRGQSLLPTYLVPIAGGPETVSGTKGETLNSVMGGGQVYTVRVTTPLNCQGQTSDTVGVAIHYPKITLNQTPNDICDPTKTSPAVLYDGTVSATVSFNGSAVSSTDPNYTYSWYDGTTTTTPHSPATTTNSITGLQDGKWFVASVTRSDLHCTTIASSIEVQKATIQPLLQAVSTGSNNCDPTLTPDGTVTASIITSPLPAGHNYTYQWYDGTTTAAPALGVANTGTTATVTKVGGPHSASPPVVVPAPLSPNNNTKTYTVLVTDVTNGCQNTTSQSVSDVSVIPVLGTSTTPNSICSPASKFNGSFIISLTNPVGTYVYPTDFSFSWYNSTTTSNPITPATTSDLVAKTITATTLDVGDYAVVAKNTKTGCTSSVYTDKVITAKVYPALLPASTGSNNCDQTLTPDGTASYSVTNLATDAGPFTQQWYTGSGDPRLGGMTSLTATNNYTNVTAIKIGGPNIPLGSAPRPYTVLVTNSVTGCQNYTTASVSDNSAVPTVLTSTTPNAVCDPAKGLQGTMTATIKTIPAGYTVSDYRFRWFNGTDTTSFKTQQASPLTGLDSKSYTVAAKNMKTGCKSTPATDNVGNSKTLPSLAPVFTGSNNCVADGTVVNGVTVRNDGVASVTPTGTPGGYSYQWYDGKNDLTTLIATPVYPVPNSYGVKRASADATSQTLNNVGGPGGATYTTYVYDQTTGCASFLYVSVPDNSAIPKLGTATTPNDICSPASSFAGTMTASLNNTAPNIQVKGTFPNDYTFVWSSGPTITGNATLSKLDAGSYTVTATNNLTGCVSGSATDKVSDGKNNPALTITATGSHNCSTAITPDGTASVAVTPQGADTFAYVWTPVGAAPAGTSGAPTNVASPPSSTINKVGGPNTGSPGTPFSYNILVTDIRTQCFTLGQAQVQDLSQKPVPSLQPFDNGICDPTKASVGNYNGHLDVTGVTNNIAAGYAGAVTYQYTWTDVTNPVVAPHPILTQTNTASTSYTQLPGGDYTGVVTILELGCVSDPVQKNIKNLPTLPALSVTPTPSTNCAPVPDNGAIDAQVTNANPGEIFAFRWSQGNTITALIPHTDSVLPPDSKIAGQKGGFNYTVEATNTNTGCVFTYTQTLADDHILPQVSLGFTQNDICNLAPIGIAANYDGTVTATVTNPSVNTYTYAWTNTVTSTSLGGGTGTGSTNTLGNLNGTAPANNYAVIATDNVTGCVSKSQNINVTNNFAYPTATNSVTASTTCPAAPTPNGIVAITGITSPLGAWTYDFKWYDGAVAGVGSPKSTPVPVSNTATTSTYSNVQGGAGQFYTVMITVQETGCQTPISLGVPDHSKIPVLGTLSETDNTFCVGSNGTASIGTTTAPAASASLTDVNNGGIQSPPYNGYTFNWSNGSNGTYGAVGTIMALSAGTYSVTATNTALGCTSAQVSVNVSNNEFVPVIDVAITQQTSCDTSHPNGVLTATVNETTKNPAGLAGVTAGYTFTWIDEITNLFPPGTPAVNVAGSNAISNLKGNQNYDITVLNPTTGCTTTQKVWLIQTLTNPTVTTSVTDLTICSPPNGQVQATGAGGTGAYDYFWWDGSTAPDGATVIAQNNCVPVAGNCPLYGTISTTTSAGDTYGVLAPGSYTVVVLDQNTKCYSSQLISTVKDASPAITILVTDVSLPTDCVSTNSEMKVTANGVTAGFSFDWYKGVPSPTDPSKGSINYFTNLPVYTPSTTVATGSDVFGLASNLYTVQVTNTTPGLGFGCKAYQPHTLPFQGSQAVIKIFKANSTTCPYTSGNGEIKIQIQNPVAPAPVFKTGVTISGTITCTTGSPTVTGSGTSFNTDVEVGDILADLTGAVIGTVSLIGSNTSLTLTANAAVAVTGAGYENTTVDQPDYNVFLYENGSAITTNLSGTGNRTSTKTAPFLVSGSLKPDSYIVGVQETYSGSYCFVYQDVIIGADALPPVISLAAPIKQNDACTATYFDGQISINVATDPADMAFTNEGVSTTFGITMSNPDAVNNTFSATSYTGIVPFPVSNYATWGTPSSTIPVPAGTNTALTTDGPFTASKLAPANSTNSGSYTFTAYASSGCFSSKTYTIQDNPVVPELLDGNISITNAEYCVPKNELSAKAVVNKIVLSNGNLESIPDYKFNWYNSSGTDVFSPGGVVGGGATNGDQFYNNGATVPILPYNTVTAGSYTVTVTKWQNGLGTSPKGIGCTSTPFPFTIKDNSVNPTVAITPTGSTACFAGVGAIFDGSLLVKVTTATGPGSAATYQYDWTTTAANGGTPTTPNPGQTGNNNNQTLLQDGNYTLIATNEITGCKTSFTTTLDKVAPPVFTVFATPSPQTGCAPTNASITVTDVTVDDGINPVTHEPNNFTYSWYLNSPTTAAIATTTPPALTLNSGNYAPIAAGSYYVQAVRKIGVPKGSGCPSAPVNEIILDQRTYPNPTLTPLSNTACSGAFEGQVTANVTDASAGTFTFGFTDTSTQPTHPVVVGPPGAYNGGTNYVFPNLQDADYTITTTNNTTGCSATANATIVKDVIPVFVNAFKVVNQFYCNPSGSVTVTNVTYKDRTGTLQNELPTDFTYAWSLGGVPINGSLPTHDGPTIDSTTYAPIAAGLYQVVATKKLGASAPGEGCSSAPATVQIIDKSVLPKISLTPFSNTACTGAFEGEIKVQVTDASVARANVNMHNYSYTWTTSPNPMTNSTGNNGNQVNDIDPAGTSLVGTTTYPYPALVPGPGPNDRDDETGLQDGPYVLQVTNTATGCSYTASSTITKNAVPVFVQSATSTPQILCDLVNGDGSVTVTKVTVTNPNGTNTDFVSAPTGTQGNISDFNFDWSRAVVAGTQTTAGNALTPPPGTYDKTKFANTLIGADTYTVVATRANGHPGFGCKSAPFTAVIKDERYNPSVTLSAFSNTSCLNTAPEGEIKVTVTDTNTTVHPSIVPAGGFTFNYDWTGSVQTNPPTLTSTGNNGNQVNDGAGPDHDDETLLVDGNYTIKVTNPTTQCFFNQTVIVPKNATPVFVQNVALVDQILCTPDGSLTVTKVTLNDRTGASQTFDNTTVPAMLTDFQFEWTRPSDAHVEIMNGAGPPVGPTLQASNYDVAFASQPFGAGTYSVVARRKAGSPGAQCASAPYTVVLQDKSIKPVPVLTPFANTSCDPTFFEGEIEVNVTDATANNSAHTFITPFAYTYNWTASATTAVINGAVAGTNNGDGSAADGDGDNPKTLLQGNYTVLVTNTQTGCSSPGSTIIYKNSTPVFTQLVTPTDQVLCSADGKLVVNQIEVIDRNGNTKVSPTDFPISDFSFIYDRGTVGTNVLGSTLAPSSATQLDKTNYSTIGFDTYFVTAVRTNGTPGLGCSASPYKVDILDKRIFPSVSLTPFANTSCDPTFFEGEITVKVTDASVNLPAPLLPGPNFSYTYNWTASATPGIIPINTPIGPNNGDASAADGDGDNPKSLSDGNYAISVTNTETGCTSPGQTTIFRNSTPVFTQLVTSTPQVLCNPDGSLTVKEVKIIDRNGVTESNLSAPPNNFPLSDFTFTYDRTTVGNTVFVDVNNNSPQLNNVNYTSIGFDTYYVTAKRAHGFPGTNCSSAPYRVDIQDQRVYPTVNFRSIANSTCPDPITGAWNKANGSLTAIAAEPSGTTTGPYGFSWTLNGNPVASATPTPTEVLPTVAKPNLDSLLNALDGAYVVTVNNATTGCPFAASFNLLLDQSRSTPNIISVLTQDPLDCNPTAGAQVTEITLGSTTNSALIPPQTNNIVTGAGLNPPRFVYSWYEGSLSNKLSYTNSPCIGPGCAPATTGLLVGDHFVTVLDNNTNCQSGPKQFTIKPDNVISPIVGITQTIKQISCIATVGTAALQATAVEGDQNNPHTVGNYTFTWYPSLDLTGTALGPPNTTPPNTTNPNILQQLMVGNYSVQVKNTVTSCTASAFFIVPDDSPLFHPSISTGVYPQTFCVGSDGDASVRIILDPNYPLLPYDSTAFTVDLYKRTSLGDSAVATSMYTDRFEASPGVIVYDSAFDATHSKRTLYAGTYKFKVTDKNTGCITTDTTVIKLQRTNPVVTVVQDDPMKNCDPTIADGQLSATADGGLIQGYKFDWYAGATATGSIRQTDNKLIGQRAGQYTVRTTNNLTGCFADMSGNIQDATVIPPVPTAITLHDRTSCVTPNGEVSASVGGVTLGYSFQWYNGTSTKSTPDYKYSDYMYLDTGTYTVTATDEVTLCVSPPTSTPVADKRVKPVFHIDSTPSYCIDTGRPNGNGTFTVTPEVSEGFLSILWSLQGDTTTVVGQGLYVTDLWPGDYHVLVTTDDGCENSADATIETEIKPYNLISANNDGQNDGFTIDCISNFPNNNVKIFNRNGTMVYEADGYNNLTIFFRGVGEKGVYLSDKELPEGTYFYIIDKRNGTKPKTGFIELVR
jgi:hypothetical protein